MRYRKGGSREPPFFFSRRYRVLQRQAGGKGLSGNGIAAPFTKRLPCGMAGLRDQAMMATGHNPPGANHESQPRCHPPGTGRRRADRCSGYRRPVRNPLAGSRAGRADRRKGNHRCEGAGQLSSGPWRPPTSSTRSSTAASVMARRAKPPCAAPPPSALRPTRLLPSSTLAAPYWMIPHWQRPYYERHYGHGWGDRDRDGVPNRHDAAPRNPWRS